MKSFWADWKAKGSPPIVRGSIRVGQPKRKPAPSPKALWPTSPPIRKTVLTEEDREFARKIGMRLPKTE
jgi:hypothetical protein